MRSPDLPRSNRVADLCVETDLLNRINPITSVQSLPKNFLIFGKTKSVHIYSVPSPQGALAIVTTRGGSAVDAAASGTTRDGRAVSVSCWRRADERR